MSCCPDCIDDRWLTDHIFPTLEHHVGVCAYCNNHHAMIVRPVELRDRFEMVVSAYIPDSQGKRLVEWLQADWLMFPAMDPSDATKLLADILDDQTVYSQRFSPKPDKHDSKSIDWNVFREELMYQNRFFLSVALNEDDLTISLANIVVRASDIPDLRWRARIQEHDQSFSVDEMGAPPVKASRHGRANPAGIPYLYLASDVSTAGSEVRPHTGDSVNMMRFSLSDSLQFVDLRNPRKFASPFLLDKEDEIFLMRRDIALLEHLSQELMRPVLPKDAAIEYIPSQYLCEFIKKCGFDGVVYNSSVGAGFNLALFDPGKAKPVDGVQQYKVKSVIVKLE